MIENGQFALTKKNRTRLGRLILKLYENAHKVSKDSQYRWHRQQRGITLDDEGGRHLREAIQVIQTVPKWKEAYPPEAIMKRVIDAMFEGGELDGIVGHIIASLDKDCKPVRAYVPFFGFHLEQNVHMQIGSYVLRTLGEEGVEREIIGRLNEHMKEAGKSAEESERQQERYRQALLKFPNIPILVVDFFGSVDGAREFVGPVAGYIALFIQFCIGALTERFFDNPLIVDYTGRFTGDWATFMPVMTVEYDRLAFPNLQGFHPDFSFSQNDIETLRDWGVLDVGDEFLKEVKSNDSIGNLLVRAMCSFADGERAISQLSRMSAYVTAAEVFFSRRIDTMAWVTAGMAAANSDGETDYEQNLAYATAIYDDRSRALHDGFEPTFTYAARKLARGSILRMVEMRAQLATRKKVQSWLQPRVDVILEEARKKKASSNNATCKL